MSAQSKRLSFSRARSASITTGVADSISKEWIKAWREAKARGGPHNEPESWLLTLTVTGKILWNRPTS